MLLIVFKPIDNDTGLRYALDRFVFEFYKNRIGDVVIVTSFMFSSNNCAYLKF